MIMSPSRPLAQLQVMWRSGSMYYYYGGRNTGTMFFDAWVVGGGPSQHEAMWTSPEMVTRDRSDGNWDGWYDLPDFEYQAWYFDVYGDQALEIHIAADVDIVGRGYYHLGIGEEVFEPEDDWGSRLRGYQACDVEAWPEQGGVHNWSVQPLDSGLPIGVRSQPWRTVFTICQLED